MPDIALVGEAWGEEEFHEQHPFVGVSGIELLKILADSGHIELSKSDRHSIYSNWNDPPMRRAAVRAVWSKLPFLLSNVFQLRPPNNDIEALCCDRTLPHIDLPAIRPGKYVRAEFLPELERLSSELATAAPNLVIALGGTASWALLHNASISKIRGTIALSADGRYKVLPVYHPAAILRQWDLRAVTVIDFTKARSESRFPEIRRPKRQAWIEPDLGDIERFYKGYLERAGLISFDIETHGDQITCIGFAPSAEISLVIPFVDNRKPNGSYWPTQGEEFQAWLWVKKILGLPCRKLAQNGLYDITFLWKGYGIPVANSGEDTMLLHHALQPESLKGLGYLASVYANESDWKNMRTRGKTTIKRDE